MLEPWSPASLASSPHRIVQVRTGFDLEPALPDPAPAFADPEGALHPALLEGLAALPLHSYPTPAARSALVSQLLSEPGRPDLSDPQDPFMLVYRHTVHKDMEAEVTGNLALLLVRGLMAQVQRQHRPQLPDPAEALLDPDNDPWRHRRARLYTSDWEPLWIEVEAAAGQCGNSDVFGFERCNILAAHRWLAMYRAWWGAAGLLDATELCPTEPETCDALDAALAEVRRTCARSLDLADEDPSIASLLGAAIKSGCGAERSFMEATGSRPSEGLISARWLLNQQLRSLRHLSLATREHSLRLHALMRASDVARVAVQIAYRAALMDLWLSDVRGTSSRELEDQLVALPSPPHQTTLGAGLGRVQGAVLVRRLRRGEEAGALQLAEAALQLAPEELAVRMAWNDLRFQNRPSWDNSLLSSLRAEQERWESLPVLLMGTKVADLLGEQSRARWFREHLLQRALHTDGFGPWAVVVMETLARVPGRDARLLLETLEDLATTLKVAPDSATWVLFASKDPELLQAAFEDLRTAVSEALEDIDQAENLVPTQLSGPGRKSQASAWQQLVNKKLPAAGGSDFPGAAWSRIQEIRAAAPDLRKAPLAAEIRALQELLSRAADILAQQQEARDRQKEQGNDEGAEDSSAEINRACEQLAEVMTQLAGYLHAPSQDAADTLAGWLNEQIDPLRVAIREPRALHLEAELSRLTAVARVQDRQDLISAGSEARAAIARARTASDADSAFSEIDLQLGELRGALYEVPAERPKGATPDSQASGIMVIHEEFEHFSCQELGMLPDALRRAQEMIRLFNLSGGRRDRKRLKGKHVRDLFELRHRTARSGGLRVFYQRDGRGWQALAAMSKYDDRQQREAIERIRHHFQAGA